MKNNCYLIFLLLPLFLSACRYEPPSEGEVEKRFIQFFESINLPFEIQQIKITPKKYNRKYYSIEIGVNAKIYSDDKKSILYMVNNTYSSKFTHITYGYWFGRFELERKAPPDSIIYLLCSKYFSVEKTALNITQLDSFNETQKFYPVQISVNQNGMDRSYLLPFSQDEFGIWKIGINELITPESTVKSFLSEVNKGNTHKARRYFSYDYMPGYDEIDRNNLENLFSKGSIREVKITDIYTVSDTTWLNVFVEKNDSGIFRTNLELIRSGIEWRILYSGWDWKFKSPKLQ